jgi:phosphatidylinositol alpha-1,6-mannosyltransferase
MSRITLVSRNFPPLTGGMERLVHQLYNSLRRNHELVLIGPAGCEAYAADGDTVSPSTISPTPVFLLLSLLKGIFLHFSSGRAEVVIGGSGLMAPVVFLIAKLSGAKTILLVHGLDLVADSRLYQKTFVPLFRRFDLVIANSKNTARLAMQSGVSEQSIAIINPGADLPAIAASQDTAKQSLGVAGRTVLLSVGRLIPRKGLAEFVANSFAGLAANPDMLLLVAGVEPANALNRAGESVHENIEAAVATHGLAGQVQLLGKVSDEKIARLYAAADAFVFPLVETHGDVEGFGMVAIEAAAHGTPTVAFDCGGVGDAVEEGKSGYLVPPGDYAQFSNAVLDAVRGKLRESSRTFAADFTWDAYGAKTEACIAEVLIR